MEEGCLRVMIFNATFNNYIWRKSLKIPKEYTVIRSHIDLSEIKQNSSSLNAS